VKLAKSASLVSSSYKCLVDAIAIKSVDGVVVPRGLKVARAEGSCAELAKSPWKAAAKLTDPYGSEEPRATCAETTKSFHDDGSTWTATCPILLNRFSIWFSTSVAKP